jgi:hypothetical protein
MLVAQQFCGAANALRKQIVVRHVPFRSENFGYGRPFGMRSRSWVDTGTSKRSGLTASKSGAPLTKSFGVRLVCLVVGRSVRCRLFDPVASS